MCTCFDLPFCYLDFDTLDLAPDGSLAEAQIDTCKKCGTRWVKYMIEQPYFSKSGRWWRAPISKTDSSALTANNAKAYIEQQEWCFVGGSFYDGKIKIKTRPIVVI